MNDDLFESGSAEQEVSWFFNDINLTMVIIVLFFAIVFASMISESEGMRDATSDQTEIEKERPAELSSYEYFGEVGFPQSERAKGYPVKDTFNEDLILIDQTNPNDRLGIDGNVQWDFQQLEQIRERKTLVVQLDEQGQFSLDDQLITQAQLQGQINELARVHNVFVRLHVSPTATIAVYENARNTLWNESDAIHWQFTTQPVSAFEITE